MERPVLMWLSFYNPGDRKAEPPTEPRHLGTCIVRSHEAAHGRQVAKDLGIDPGGDVLTQGLSAASAAFYEPHLNVLLNDEQLIERFGEEGVFLADGKTKLSEFARPAHSPIARNPLSAVRSPALEHTGRRPYEPPAIIESESPPARRSPLEALADAAGSERSSLEALAAADDYPIEVPPFEQ